MPDPQEVPPKLAPGVEALPSDDPDLQTLQLPSGSTLKIHRNDWRIALLMDGTRTLVELAHLARADSVEDIRGLVQEFDGYGLLEHSGAALPPGPPWLASDEDLPLPPSLPNIPLPQPPQAPFPEPVDEPSVVIPFEEAVEDPSPAAVSPPPPSTPFVATVDELPRRNDETTLPPPPTREFREPRDPPRSKGRWGRGFLLLLLLAALVGLSLVKVPVQEAAQLRAARRWPLAANTQVTVRQWVKHDGDSVRQGEVIALLGDSDLEGARKALEAEIAARKEKSNQSPAPAVAAAPTADAAALRKALVLKRRRAFAAAAQLKKLEAQLENGSTSQEAVDEAILELEDRRKEVNVAQAELNNLGRKSPPTQVAVPAGEDPELKTLQEKLKALNTQAAQSTLTSPADGVLLLFAPEPLEGSVLAPGKMLGEIVDPDSMQLLVYVRAESLRHVKTGVGVQFVSALDPGKTFACTVAKISSSSRWTAEAQRNAFVATAVLSQKTEGLTDGAVGNARISGTQRPLYEVWKEQLFYWRKSRGI